MTRFYLGQKSFDQSSGHYYLDLSNYFLNYYLNLFGDVSLWFFDKQKKTFLVQSQILMHITRNTEGFFFHLNKNNIS